MSIKTFTPEAVRDLKTTASIVPSSRYLAQAMLATRPLLALLPPEAKVLSFEVNPRFCAYLKENFTDPRLEVIPGSAERLPEELAARGLGPVDAALSSLGLTTMPDRVRRGIVQGLVSVMAPHGVFTQFQYLHSLLAFLQPRNGGLKHFTAASFLRQYFAQVSSEIVWRNFPPAFALTCRR